MVPTALGGWNSQVGNHCLSGHSGFEPNCRSPCVRFIVSKNIPLAFNWCVAVLNQNSIRDGHICCHLRWLPQSVLRMGWEGFTSLDVHKYMWNYCMHVKVMLLFHLSTPSSQLSCLNQRAAESYVVLKQAGQQASGVLSTAWDAWGASPVQVMFVPLQQRRCHPHQCAPRMLKSRRSTKAAMWPKSGLHGPGTGPWMHPKPTPFPRPAHLSVSPPPPSSTHLLAHPEPPCTSSALDWKL